MKDNIKPCPLCNSSVKEKIESISRLVHNKIITAKYEIGRSTSVNNDYWKGQEISLIEIQGHLNELLTKL